MSQENKNEKKDIDKEKVKSRFVGSVKNNDDKNILDDSEVKIDTSPPLKKLDEKDLKNDSVRELLEKNLKWSQIIYEQNRKIKRTLTWSAIGSWVRIFLFLLPFIIAAIYLWPIYKSAQFQLFDILTEGTKLQNTTATTTDNSALKSLLKVIPMSEEQQNQINALIDNNKQ